MALLGSDFDSSQPAGASTNANQIDESIRDIKTRLKAWGTIYRDLETGLFKNNIIPSSALIDSGVTPGTYGGLTINAKGQVTSASSFTTLSQYGITDAESVTSVKAAQYGGTGLDASSAANGALFIGTGSGVALANMTAGEGIEITNGSGSIELAVSLNAKPWFARTTFSSAAATMAVDILPDDDVPTGKKVILQGFILKVNGGTLWATTTEVKIQDKAGSPNDFVTIAVAALAANATVFPSSADVTLENPMALGTGGSDGKGLQIVGDANGTGSNIVISAWGVLVDV